MAIKVLKWVAICIVAVILIVFGLRGVQIYNQTHQKTPAEIIKINGNSILAAQEKRGGLFTFGIKDVKIVNADGTKLPAEDLAPGMLITVVGPDYWQTTYPLGYPDVKKVIVVDTNQDLITGYFNHITKQYANATRDEITAYIDTLANLTEGEKEGLSYLVLCSLSLF